jgi:hypothetical protein
MGSSWDFNHWFDNNKPPAGTYTNPSYLGDKTQMRQELPTQVDGVAKIRLDTWNDYNSPAKASPPNTDPNIWNSFTGSEAITKQSWAADASGGIAFEGVFRFQSPQGGMITGFFGYQDFFWPPNPPIRAERATHDELDFEILTTQLAKISTNVFTNAKGGDSPESIAVPANSFQDFHTYRIEWYQDSILWFVDGNLIRTEATKNLIPTKAQQLHLNLWGVPGGPYPSQWLKNPGDPNGPNVGDPSFQPAAVKSDNKIYYFDVSAVKVERLPVKPGTDAADSLTGTSASEHVSGGGGNDQLNGLAGNDVLVGGSGDDSIDGGDGSDTALFSGARSDYAVLAAGAVTTITDTRAASDADGSDRLTNVEFASFSDGLYAIGANGVLTLVPVSIGPSTFVERYVQDDAYVVKQGHTLTVGTVASVLSDDSSGTPMTAALGQGPSHGTLQLAADGTLTYIPESGYSGIDSFTYIATDSDGVIGEANVALYIAPINGGVLNLAALTVEQQVASMYTGLLGRGADLDGFFYWANQFLTDYYKSGPGTAIRNVANAMGSSDEAKAALPFLANPQGASDAQIGTFIDSVYNNLFDRTADAAGRSYWVSQVKQTVAANQAPGAVVASIISGAQDTVANQDITTLLNKVAVNLHFAYSQFLIDENITDLVSARTLIDAVTSTQESVLVGLKTAEILVFAPTA